MKFYPGTNSPVPLDAQAQIRKDRFLQASWRSHYALAQERKRAEDSHEWTLRIPREAMDIILADPSLGVREHLALAATSPELRRLYHNSHIWQEILQTRTVPRNGVQVLYERPGYSPRPPGGLDHLATAPQKKKANGPNFKRLHDPYSLHRDAISGIHDHV
ncbi:hypothetical protein FB451DRAFT_1221357, partial [Mycena latifolia]